MLHNTDYGGDIETGHHVISSMSSNVTNYFAFPVFTAPGPGTLRVVIYNDLKIDI